MWLKRRSRLRCWYALIVFALVITPIAHAFLPALIAESAIGAIVGRIIINRAARVAANDAVYLTVVNGTEKAISKAAVSQAAKVTSKKSIYKNVSGALTWAGVGYSLSDTPVESLLPQGVKAATTGTQREDGKWDVTIDGKTYISDYEPTPESPYLASVNIDANGQAVVAEDVDEVNYPIYAKLVRIGSNTQYFMGYDVSAVAQSYVSSYKARNMMTCPSGTCTFGGTAINSIVKGTDRYTVSTSTQRTSSASGRDDKVDQYNMNVIVFISPKYTGTTPITENNVQDNPDEASTNPDYSQILKALDDVPLKIDDLTKTINDLFLSGASQPDYEGVPVTSSNPVTADEVRAAYPNVESLKQSEWLKPAQVSETSPLNVSIPSPAAVGSTENPAKVDLGEDPGVATPELEDIPTGEDILKPITTMFSDYNDSVQLREVACPVYTVDLFGQHYVMDSQCELSEANKSLIASVFLAFWGFTAFRIVLRA